MGNLGRYMGGCLGEPTGWGWSKPNPLALVSTIPRSSKGNTQALGVFGPPLASLPCLCLSFPSKMAGLSALTMGMWQKEGEN